MGERVTKTDRVRKYWRNRVRKLEAQLRAEKEAHENTRASKLVAARADPNVPRDTLFFLSMPNWRIEE